MHADRTLPGLGAKLLAIGTHRNTYRLFRQPRNDFGKGTLGIRSAFHRTVDIDFRIDDGLAIDRHGKLHVDLNRLWCTAGKERNRER